MIQIICILMMGLLVGCENNHISPGIKSDFCNTDIYARGIKKLVYSKLVKTIKADTIYIVSDILPMPDTIPYYARSLNYFFDNLPFDLDTSTKNTENISSIEGINCLLDLCFENLIFKNITEKELIEKKVLGRKNIYFRFSNIKLFKKEKIFGLECEDFNKPGWFNRHYYLISVINQKVYKMSSQME